MIDNLTLRIQTAESAEERRGRKMCQILCEPQRPLRFKNKDKIHEKSNRRERGGTRRMGKCVRYSANLSVLCGSKTKIKFMKNQTAESAEERGGW